MKRKGKKRQNSNAGRTSESISSDSSCAPGVGSLSMLPSIAIPLRRCGSASDMAQRKGATKSEGATEGVGQGLRGRYFGTYIQDKRVCRNDEIQLLCIVQYYERSQNKY